MMDKEILKLLPQKAFKLLSIKDTLRIGAIVTKSVLDKKSFGNNFQKKLSSWKWSDITLSLIAPPTIHKPHTKESGEKILKIYFTQFFENKTAVHLDLRISSFSEEGSSLIWVPSKLHYNFSDSFINGVQSLYIGFYRENEDLFIKGLVDLGMITNSMSEIQKTQIIELFLKHFGEGKSEPINFSLTTLQTSFNAIFSFFLKEDIPLNPEFAVLGINLVTLYLTLEQITQPLDVKNVFSQVYKTYRPD